MCHIVLDIDNQCIVIMLLCCAVETELNNMVPLYVRSGLQLHSIMFKLPALEYLTVNSIQTPIGSVILIFYSLFVCSFFNPLIFNYQFLFVHYVYSYLFWADSGRQPKIERSDLAGGSRTLIASHSLIRPTTLCIDIVTDRLYWSDPGRGTIEFSNLHGGERGILASDPQRPFHGIAILQVGSNYLFT